MYHILHDTHANPITVIMILPDNPQNKPTSLVHPTALEPFITGITEKGKPLS